MSKHIVKSAPEHLDPDHLVSLKDEYLVHLKVTRSQKTVEHAEWTLDLFCQWCLQHGIHSVLQIRRQHLQQWQLNLLETYSSKATVWSICCDIKAFLNWCYREDIIPQLPYKQGDFVAKPKPKPKPLTGEEVVQLMESLRGRRWIDVRDRAIVFTLIVTGMRRGELLQLRVGDIDKRIVTVVQKGDRQHVVYLPNSVCAELKRYVRLYRIQTKRTLKPDDLLWRADDGKPLTGNAVRLIMDRISRRTGIDVWAHRLRATSATFRLGMQASTELTRLALGHEDDRSIRAYVKLAQEDVFQMLEETSPDKYIQKVKERMSHRG